MFKRYREAMRFANSKYGRAHLSNVIDEIDELVHDRSLEELCDVLHTIIRMTGSTWMGYVIYPCVVKFVNRYEEYGDIRSRRNLK